MMNLGFTTQPMRSRQLSSLHPFQAGNAAADKRDAGAVEKKVYGPEDGGAERHANVKCVEDGKQPGRKQGHGYWRSSAVFPLCLANSWMKMNTARMEANAMSVQMMFRSEAMLSEPIQSTKVCGKMPLKNV